ncbi:MAG: hypothetical protein ACQEQA_02740 [Bacillota bacterium]
MNTDNHKDKTEPKVIEKPDWIKPEKNFSMIFTMFALSTAFPVLGVILYHVWKNDEPILARASLIGFFLNVSLIAFTILSSS